MHRTQAMLTASVTRADGMLTVDVKKTGQLNGTMIPLTGDQLVQIDAALQEGRPVDAIRLYREATQSPLPEAIKFIESRHQKPETLPGSLQTFLSGNFGRKGELAGWWRNLRNEICVLVLFERDPAPRFELSVFPENVGSWANDLNGYTLTLADLTAALEGVRTLYSAEWRDGTEIIQRLRSFTNSLAEQTTPPSSNSGTTLFLLDQVPFETEFLHLPQLVPRSLWENLSQRAEEDSSGVAIKFLGDLAKLSPAAGKIIWSACRRHCCVSQASSESTDTFFADLESNPPAWNTLPPMVQPAWEAFIRLGGVSGQRTTSLPWWLERARAGQDCHAGILLPHEARLIQRHGIELTGLFEPTLFAADFKRFYALICLAAASGGFCVVWEPGT